MMRRKAKTPKAKRPARGSELRRCIFHPVLPDGRVITYHATRGWRVK